MALRGDMEEKKVQAVLEEFVGDILQRPPVRAAVRRDVRKRRIYYIRDVEIDGREVLFRVGCQAGTYIRKLVYDVGEVLGVGAHMRELRRTRAGSFTEEESFSLYDLMELSELEYCYEDIHCVVYIEGRTCRLVEGANVERTDDEGGSRTGCENSESNNAC